MMEMKIGIVHLIKNFTIVPTAKTSIPLKLKKNSGFVLLPENGFWLGLKQRI